MSADVNARRKFLQAAGAGLAGTTLLGGPVQASAQVVPSHSGAFFLVTQFGAKGDGQSLDTQAVNAAIEAASRAGGGTVFFPSGNYLCHSIRLKSHITLLLDPGATIVAADSNDGQSGGYDSAESNAPWEAYQDFGHNHWHNSLIWGEGLENVAIIGRGLIWGKGLSRGWSNEKPLAETPGVGNKAIALKNCRNVLLRDFSILHGGHFALLATGVDNFSIDNLAIDTNRDGIDIDCCRDVRVSNCAVNSPWDDGICLKSSYALGYARATERVMITNCMVSGSFQEGTLLDASYKRFSEDEKVARLGRIKFGTESNGGFKNITISNCVFDGCHGLAIESVDGAVIEGVCVSNITMRGIVDSPIFIRLGSRMRGPEGVPVGAIRRVTISGINCMNAAGRRICSIISGIPGHPIEDLKLCDITITHSGGGTAEDSALRLPEKEAAYPDPNMFGTTPAQGFFIRHARNVEMSGIRIEALKPDERPACVLTDVRGADFRFMKLPQPPGKPNFVLEDVTDFSVFKSKPVPDAELSSAAQKTR